jgi:A/G-specific adenine glycosylase
MTRVQRTSTYIKAASMKAPSMKAPSSDAATARTKAAATPAARSAGADGSLPDSTLCRSIHAALLGWYARRRRNLPWRSTRDPYCIWVSEIMLQQTRVQSVVAYYERWIQRFPSVERLASADGEDVLRAWEGLGYYSRARNLQRAARQLVADHGGRLPRSIAELRALPGIGPYSAGAIASIAFDADEPVVDGNVIRVLTRLFGLSGNPRRGPLAGHLWQLARHLLPTGKAADFNQALMELGATVCTPRGARCAECPVAGHCQALAQDRVDALPEAPPRPALSDEHRAAAVVIRRGQMLVLRAAPDAVRWAGMWQFPDLKLAPGEAPELSLPRAVADSSGVSIELGAQLGSIQHHVTRFRIQIEVYEARAIAGRARAASGGEARWCTPEALSALAMPLCHRKIARAAVAHATAGEQP